MKQRIITGAILTIIVGLFIGFSHLPYVINTFVFILSCFCIYEALNAADNFKNNTLRFVPYLLAFSISFAEIPYYIYIILVLFVITSICFLIMMTNIDKASLKEKYKSFLFSIYIPLSFRALIEMRATPNGLFLVIATIVATTFTDIFAHLCGTAFGKHKIFPKISPKKTIEGSLSGILVTLFVSLTIVVIITPSISLHTNIFLSTIFFLGLSLVGEFGDLSLSSYKRVCDIKDFSNLLPGHGGVLDRFDSLLFTAPYAFIFTHFINLW